MGAINPRALFLDLLHDLSGVLDPATISSYQAGRKLDPYPDCNAKEFGAMQLANSFYKKFLEDENVANDAEQRALELFLQTNEKVGNWRYSPCDSWDEVLLGELKSTIYDFFYPKGEPLIPNLDAILDGAKVGNGASLKGRGSDIYSKMFDSQLTVTSNGLYRAYTAYNSGQPLCLDAEKVRRERWGSPLIVEGNRIHFVPKNAEIARVSCTEPTLNMWFQLGLANLLEERLKTFFGIDLSKQPDINRELCRRGSIDESFATIDLKSASDTLGLSMLTEVLPAQQLCWFLGLRSPVSTLPDGSTVKLNMISTMGNGFTFPLQTMLFAAIVVSSARARDLHLVRPRADSDATYGVFGDDIIVPTGIHYDDYHKVFVNYGSTLVSDVLRLLRLLGQVVNQDKSFIEGPFRESCGHDYYNGQFVRGVYIKSLRTVQDRFVAINNLLLWSHRCGIPLVKSLRRLLRTVPKYGVPLHESEDAGIRVPLELVKGFKQVRSIQSISYRLYRSKPVYRALIDKKRSTPEWVVLKGRYRNYSGLLLALLNGHIRAYKIGIKTDIVSYRRVRAVTPCWDYCPDTVAGKTPAGRSFRMTVQSCLGKTAFEA